MSQGGGRGWRAGARNGRRGVCIVSHQEVSMRGAFRVHSLLGLAVLLGWSLFASARERIAPQRTISPPRTAPRAPFVPRVVGAKDWSVN
jgi:hypothetical protein